MPCRNSGRGRRNRNTPPPLSPPLSSPPPSCRCVRRVRGRPKLCRPPPPRPLLPLPPLSGARIRAGSGWLLRRAQLVSRRPLSIGKAEHLAWHPREPRTQSVLATGNTAVASATYPPRGNSRAAARLASWSSRGSRQAQGRLRAVDRGRIANRLQAYSTRGSAANADPAPYRGPRQRDRTSGRNGPKHLRLEDRACRAWTHLISP